MKFSRESSTALLLASVMSVSAFAAPVHPAADAVEAQQVLAAPPLYGASDRALRPPGEPMPEYDLLAGPPAVPDAGERTLLHVANEPEPPYKLESSPEDDGQDDRHVYAGPPAPAQRWAWAWALLGRIGLVHQEQLFDDKPGGNRILETGGNVVYVGNDNLKFKLKRDGINFLDITDHVEFYNEIGARGAPKPPTPPSVSPFPANLSYIDDVTALFANISQANLKLKLATFSSFRTRYYKSEHGLNASLWLADAVTDVIKASGREDVGVRTFPHPWGQKSVIATIEGAAGREARAKEAAKKNKNAKPNRQAFGADGDVVVVSAHLDSINLLFPSILPAPGADDNGSGSMTILEVFRILVESGFAPRNTLQFHWYSAEEGGLLGSQAVLTEYRRRGVAVRALLQQDMTGYPGRGVEHDEDAQFGLMTDFVDPQLTRFMELVLGQYADIGYAHDTCGYGCSDHASATKVGYPAAFVMEAPLKKSNPFIHSVMDTIDRLSFGHMEQHAKITLGYAYELAQHEF